MKMEEQENNNFLRMTISDPELVQKIRESGIESLGPDDINSLGIEVKNGDMFLSDASQANLEGTNRIRMNSGVGGNSGPSPLNRGGGRIFCDFACYINCVKCYRYYHP